MMTSSRLCNACGTHNPSQAAFCMTCGGLMEADMPIPSNATGLIQQDQLLKQRYRILAQIGRGGFAAVYKAEDLHFYHRQVAVKEMSQSGLSPKERAEAVDAFTREAQMLANLQHPNLPRIYDHFTEGGRWYLVMDFIEGETLETALMQQPDQRLSLKETLDIGLQLCSVLHYLHTRYPPIIFRDLKPSNIMCTPTKHLYLIDFGIARHFKPGQTKDTIPFGSPGYAAPEQYGKAQTTPQSDIYSLGILLHHLLSGEDPSEKPFLLVPLRLAGSEALAGLENLIERMTQLDAAHRSASIAEVQAELQALVEGSSEKRAVFTLRTPLDEPRAPERPGGRERPGQIQEQVFERPVNRTRRRLVIGGLVAGAALAVGAGSLLTLFPVSHSISQQVFPTPMPAKGFPGPDVMFGYDAQHTGFNSSESVLSPANVSQLQSAWISPSIGSDIFSSPTVSGDLAFVGTTNGQVYAFDTATGQIRWVSEAHTPPIATSNVSTPAVANGVVFICLSDNRLYAFDATTGKIRWVSSAGEDVISSPTVANGVVYVTGAENVHAFDAESGKPLWVSSPPGAGYPSPAVANGLVYVNVSNNSPGAGRIAALDAATGQLRWRSDLISPGIDANGSPVVANGLIYIGADGGMAAFDATTGHVRWVSTPTKGTTGSSVAAANGLVYIAIDRVYAFDAMSGKLRWVSGVADIYNANSPFIANGVLYICASSLSNSWVSAFDAATGMLLWKAPLTQDQTFTTPTVENGAVYVAAGNRNTSLYAFRLPQK